MKNRKKTGGWACYRKKQRLNRKKKIPLTKYFNSMFSYTSSSEDGSQGKEGSNCALRTAAGDS